MTVTCVLTPPFCRYFHHTSAPVWPDAVVPLVGENELLVAGGPSAVLDEPQPTTPIATNPTTTADQARIFVIGPRYTKAPAAEEERGEMPHPRRR
jgi:hypothetical protein